MNALQEYEKYANQLFTANKGFEEFKVGGFDAETHRHVEEMKTGNSNILVAVRTRPLNSKEIGISNYETVRILDQKVVVLLDPQNEFDADDPLKQNRNREKQYAFDFAFDQNVETQQVFEGTTKFLIPGLMSGFNATVFAYGATGAGKTYTMMGSNTTPGIMVLTMNELYQAVHNLGPDKDYSVKISYIEVYNEQIRDLLSDQESVLDIREDPERGITIAGVTEIIANTTPEVMALLRIGNKNRIMEPTGANVVSSRSHAVLQLSIEQRSKAQGTEDEIIASKLSLIDLAGSERAANTNNRGQRMIEGANINRSLLALGNCITMLSERAEKGLKNVYVPYRDSKLTRLLKDSLGGNCRTVMIAAISPSVICFEDTHNTLKYANRAKSIKTNASRNVLGVTNHVENYAQIINNLKSENDQLRKLLGDKKSPMANQGESPIKKELQNQDLTKEINQQFDEEARIKKKIFELENLHDENSEQITRTMNELAFKEENKQLKEKLDSLVANQRNIMQQILENQKIYEAQASKRALIVAHISHENKASQTYLMSMFKQNQMLIENLELQHKEQRSEHVMKAKDRQIEFLKNQLNLRTSSKSGGMSVGKSSQKKGSGFQLQDLMDNLNSEADHPGSLGSITNDRLTPPLSDIVPDSGAIHRGQKGKHLPYLKPNISKRSPSINPKKKWTKPNVYRSYENNNSVDKSHSPKFYYNKQKFMEDKVQPFKPPLKKASNLVKPKKRIGFPAINNSALDKHDNSFRGNVPLSSKSIADHEKPAGGLRKGMIFQPKKHRASMDIDEPKKLSPDNSFASMDSKNNISKKKILSNLNQNKLPMLKKYNSQQVLQKNKITESTAALKNVNNQDQESFLSNQSNSTKENENKSSNKKPRKGLFKSLFERKK